MISRDVVIEYFSKFGKISDSFFGNQNNYEMIQFEDENVAQKLIMDNNCMFMNRKLNIKKRILKQDNKRKYNHWYYQRMLLLFFFSEAKRR